MISTASPPRTVEPASTARGRATDSTPPAPAQPPTGLGQGRPSLAAAIKKLAARINDIPALESKLPTLTRICSAPTRKMPTRLITDGVWATLSREAKKKTPAQVAVAYFAQGAAKLLPLSKGSRLVVDASERIVKQGQTHPKDLEAMRRRGVAVYSYPGLHAKVFVLGNVAYIGSTNVSSSSAAVLKEAVLCTTDSPVISAARTFIQGLCGNVLGPAELGRLQKLYRPPRGGGGSKAKRRQFQDLIRLAQTRDVNEPESLTNAREKGHEAAAKRRTHGRGWTVTDISWSGPSPWRRGDRIVMVHGICGSSHRQSAGSRYPPPRMAIRGSPPDDRLCRTQGPLGAIQQGCQHPGQQRSKATLRVRALCAVRCLPNGSTTFGDELQW